MIPANSGISPYTGIFTSPIHPPQNKNAGETHRRQVTATTRGKHGSGGEIR